MDIFFEDDENVVSKEVEQADDDSEGSDYEGGESEGSDYKGGEREVKVRTLNKSQWMRSHVMRG